MFFLLTVSGVVARNLLFKKRWSDVVKHLKIDFDWSVQGMGVWIFKIEFLFLTI